MKSNEPPPHVFARLQLTTTPEMFNSKVGRNTYVEYVAQELEVSANDADKIPEGFKVCCAISSVM